MAPNRRDVNDYRRRAFGGDPDRVVAFVCECDDERCRRAVLLTAAQYDILRATSDAVLAGTAHRPPTADRGESS
jgi:hypothetical protein